MIDKFIRQRIEALAYEKYLYRRDNSLTHIVDNAGNLREITPQDDYLEAEKEINAQREAIIQGIKKDWNG